MRLIRKANNGCHILEEGTSMNGYTTRNRGVSMMVLTALFCVSFIPASSAGNDKMPRRTTKRTVYDGYNYVASSSEDPVEYNAMAPVEVAVESKERWAAVTIHDATGLPVGAEIGQDVDGDGVWDETWEICGTTDAPFRIVPRKALYVNVLVGPCSETPGTATSGKVQVDLFSPGFVDAAPTPKLKTERLEQIAYTAPGFYETANGMAVGGIRVQTFTGESFLSLAATDASGLPVRIQVFPEEGPAIEVCGSTEKPVEIPEGQELTVRIFEGPCQDGAIAAATSGDIEVTLSNLP